MFVSAHRLWSVHPITFRIPLPDRMGHPLTSLSLEGKQQQESHHETEQTHSLRQGKSQNGIGEELLLKGWVTGITNDQ